MHPLQSLSAIEQDIENLERERAVLEQQKAALEAALDGLKKARDILQPGPVIPASTANEATAPQVEQTHLEKVVAFFKVHGNLPRTINDIANGAGLPPVSVTRVVYRTRPGMFDRKKLPGVGMTWRLNDPGSAADHGREARPPTGGSRPDRYQLVIAVLKDAERPLTAPEIAAEMEKRGEGRGVSNMRDIVHSVIRRKGDSFRKIERDGRVAFVLRGREAGGRGKEEGPEAAEEERQPTSAGPEIPKGLRPSEAVLYFIRKCPGATRGVIVTALEGRITTGSASPRNLLFSIIRQLEQSHQIMQSVSGKYYLVPQAEGFSSLKGKDGEKPGDGKGPAPDA